MLTNLGMDDMGTGGIADMMKNMFPAKKRKRKMKISEARTILEQQEINRLIDMDDVKDVAVKRVEQSGIIFLDEIDKICVSQSAGTKGGDVSREGGFRETCYLSLKALRSTLNTVWLNPTTYSS